MKGLGRKMTWGLMKSANAWLFELKPLIFGDICVTCAMPFAHTFANLCVFQHNGAVQRRTVTFTFFFIFVGRSVNFLIQNWNNVYVARKFHYFYVLQERKREVCIYAYNTVNLSIYLSTYIPTYIPTTYLPTNLSIYRCLHIPYNIIYMHISKLNRYGDWAHTRLWIRNLQSWGLTR